MKFAALLLLLGAAGAAQDLTGLWTGTLHAGAANLRLAVHISKSETGFTATLDSLDQGAMGIPISGVTLTDRTLKLEIAVIHGTYEGTLNAAGTEIAGTWKQMTPLPLVLKRTDKLPDLARPQEPKKPYPYNEEEVTYENKAAGVKFAGTLTLPRAGGPFAAVLLITGSGPQDRNEALMGHKPFLVLADYLTRRGLAVLRVDDRGVGGTTGPKGTTEDFTGDALAGVAYLKTRKEVDPKRIGLAGHSEGGMIAPMAASRSEEVAFIVLMAGPGVSGAKIIQEQSYAVPKASGADEEGAEMNRSIAMLMVDAAIHGSDPADARQRFDAGLAKLQANWSEAQRSSMSNNKAHIDAQIKSLTDPWFRTFLTLEPRAFLTKVKVPVLAINGELDSQVPPHQNLPAILAALEAGHNRDYTVVKLPRLNHLFQTARTGAPSEYGEIAETMAPAALEIMGNWIVGHTSSH